MLPKRSRLTSSEVREILSAGRHVRLGGLSAKYVRGAPSAKAAVVVSARVAKKATQRVALRRLAYRSLPPLPQGLRLVLFVQKIPLNPSDIAALCSRLSS